MNYILIDKKPVLELDIIKWATWFEKSKRIVKQNGLKILGQEIHASTVFLGIDHNFSGAGEPLLFETMIFDKDGDELYQERYSTWEEAEAGHEKAIKHIGETIMASKLDSELKEVL